MKIIGVQVLGIAACFLWVFPTAFIMFKLIDLTIGLRVSPEEELEGLDFTEHGGNAYPDFDISHSGSMGSVAPAFARSEAVTGKMVHKTVKQT
jgi:Amt family ammonium transporter